MYSLRNLPEDEFTRAVSDAFRQYDSTLKLSRSPLVEFDLIGPALVVDDVAPTPDERGRALRVILRWAVSRLAPSPPRFPLGTRRPFDDPTWTNPLWWRYNVLRHRYIDPLHPDDRDILGEGRFTDALLNLTGIPTRDVLFSERNRALREVASLLRRQMTGRDYDDELRRIAVEELYGSLVSRAAARKLLGIAATFRSVFPRTLLLEMAVSEGMAAPEAELDDLIAHRFLIEGDGGTNLMVPSALQVYVYARQGLSDRKRRHRWAARFFLGRDDLVLVAWHLRLAGRPAEAADVLLEAAEALIDDLRGEELREALEVFQPHHLSSSQWSEIQMLLSDLWWRVGDRARALKACRRALKAADGPIQQAPAYHRMGKLYEDHDPIRAAGYYQEAARRFPPEHPSRSEVLKDRAWISIHQREWGRAEADLEAALRIVQAGREEVGADGMRRRRADIHNAFASLLRQQGDYESALAHARQALMLREALGDASLVADSCNNIGLIYEEMGQLDAAISTYEEGLDIYRRLNQRERIATAQLNIGGAHFYAGRLADAVACYRASLMLFQEIGLPRGEAQARYNLAEALAARGDDKGACRQWREGYRLSQQTGLDDQVRWFLRLPDEFPVFAGVLESTEHAEEKEDLPERLLPAEQVAIDVARQAGHVRTKALIEAAQVSRATAKRVLGGLVEKGLLVRVGEGRATCYLLTESR